MVRCFICFTLVVVCGGGGASIFLLVFLLKHLYCFIILFFTVVLLFFFNLWFIFMIACMSPFYLFFIPVVAVVSGAGIC